MLNHPNIMKIIAVNETQNTVYIILEYFSGGSLKNIKNVSKEQIKKIMH